MPKRKALEQLVEHAYRGCSIHLGDGDELGEWARGCLAFLQNNFPEETSRAIASVEEVRDDVTA